MAAGIKRLVHQPGHQLPLHIVDHQFHVRPLGERETESCGRIEGIGVVVLEGKDARYTVSRLDPGDADIEAPAGDRPAIVGGIHRAQGPVIMTVRQPGQQPFGNSAEVPGLRKMAGNRHRHPVAIEIEIIGQRRGRGMVVVGRVPGEEHRVVGLHRSTQASGRCGAVILSRSIVAIDMHLRLHQPVPARHKILAGDEVVQIALTVDV